MLCKIFSTSVYSKLAKTNTYYLEKKYDEIRVQIYIKNNKIRIFSRNLGDLTHSLALYLQFLTTIDQTLIFNWKLTGLNFKI